MTYLTLFLNLVSRVVQPLLLWFGGRSSAENKRDKETIKVEADGKKRRKDISTASDAELDDRLRRWSK